MIKYEGKVMYQKDICITRKCDQGTYLCQGRVSGQDDVDRGHQRPVPHNQLLDNEVVS